MGSQYLIRQLMKISTLRMFTNNSQTSSESENESISALKPEGPKGNIVSFMYK